MFGSKKKKDKLKISAPQNFEHRVHTGFDTDENRFVGLPQQWEGVIVPSGRSRQPLVDASCVTQTDMHNKKVDTFILMPSKRDPILELFKKCNYTVHYCNYL